MPYLYQRFVDLEPNTVNPRNYATRSSWFSYVRRIYSLENNGTVIPPTSTQFTRTWHRYDYLSIIGCTGDTIEQCEQSLKTYQFPYYPIPRNANNRNKLIAITWVRMIMAFNMYAYVKRTIDTTPSNNLNIDFIGSCDSSNRWEYRFNGRCLLYIENSKLEHMIQLTLNGQHEDFWNNIFEIYNGINFNTFNGRQRRRASSRQRSRRQRVNVSSVDNPTHQIANEYFTRADEDETEFIPSNQHIADLIIRADVCLPNELLQTIYEICMSD